MDHFTRNAYSGSRGLPTQSGTTVHSRKPPFGKAEWVGHHRQNQSELPLAASSFSTLLIELVLLVSWSTFLLFYSEWPIRRSPPYFPRRRHCLAEQGGSEIRGFTWKWCFPLVFSLSLAPTITPNRSDTNHENFGRLTWALMRANPCLSAKNFLNALPLRS